ncbi:MAG TPA: FHA domain-containing protein [Longimicrobiaceae bacterium]|nr:FHA domain-containing protein [Longimicrobiaceae bacterium]
MEITPLGDRSGALAAFGIQSGPQAGKEVPVRLPVVRIGRAAGNDVVIPDDSVSVNHALLEFERDAWRITDLESTNGTYVEGVRLAPQVPTPLGYGSSVRFGGIPLHFRAVETADPAAARAQYVAPERAPGIREAGSGGRRIPVWLVLLLLILLAVAVVLFTTFNPSQDPPTRPTPTEQAPPAAQTAPAPAPAVAAPEAAPQTAAPAPGAAAPLPADSEVVDPMPADSGAAAPAAATP